MKNLVACLSYFQLTLRASIQTLARVLPQPPQRIVSQYPCHERVYSQRSSQLTPPLLGALRSVPSVNTSDVLSIQSEAENRFVLEQLWSSGFPHQTLWLSMFFNPDSKNHRVSRRNRKSFLLAGFCFLIADRLLQNDDTEHGKTAPLPSRRSRQCVW